MSPGEAAVLFAAATAAGGMNALAGGGTILTFPMLLLLGESAIIANATSTVALLPGRPPSLCGYRREVATHRKWLATLFVPSLVGGAAGSLLLLVTPERIFARLAPALILFATLLFFLQSCPASADVHDAASRGPAGARARGARSRQRGAAARCGAWLAQLAVAIYGGYFGAGIGILMLVVLGSLGLENIHAMNGLKNFFGMCINGVAAAIFICSGRVDWPAALVMLAGAVARRLRRRQPGPLHRPGQGPRRRHRDRRRPGRHPLVAASAEGPGIIPPDRRAFKADDGDDSAMPRNRRRRRLMTDQLMIPVLPLRDAVLFPGIALPIGAGRPSTLRAIEAALRAPRAARARGRPAPERRRREPRRPLQRRHHRPARPGAAQPLRHAARAARRTPRRRAARTRSATATRSRRPITAADQNPVDARDAAFVALFREARERAIELAKRAGLPEELVQQVIASPPIRRASPTSSPPTSSCRPPSARGCSSTLSVEERLRQVLLQVQRQLTVLDTQEEIKSKVREELGDRQREMVLREQMKAIQKELGDSDESNDIDELVERLAKLELPEPKCARRSIASSAVCAASAASRWRPQVIRTFLETVAELPWSARSEEKLDVQEAARILEQDHYGLEGRQGPRPRVPRRAAAAAGECGREKAKAR